MATRFQELLIAPYFKFIPFLSQASYELHLNQDLRIVGGNKIV